MCATLRIRDIGICTQNSIKRGNTTEKCNSKWLPAKPKLCPAASWITVRGGRKEGRHREREREEKEGEEGAVDRRAEVALLVTYAAAGKTFWQCTVYTALAMFVDMFAKVC